MMRSGRGICKDSVAQELVTDPIFRELYSRVLDVAKVIDDFKDYGTVWAKISREWRALLD